MATSAKQSDINEHHSHAYGLIIYSAFAYVVGVTGLAALVFAMAGLLPLGNVAPVTGSNLVAALLNVLLLGVWGLQHSIMARPAFKSMLNRHFPVALERSNYVLMSGVALLLVVLLWQPLSGIAWHVQGGLAVPFWLMFLAGWSYLLAATFAINHFDLFGLRQAWLAAHGQEYTPVPFKENWMYRYSRHPIMLGVLVGLWFTPMMTASALMLAVGLTVYIAIGVYFEEKDLRQSIGPRYDEYRQRVGTFFTVKKR